MYLCIVINNNTKPQQSWTERDKRFGGRVFYKRGKYPLAMKKCSTCKINKNLSFYHKDKRNNDGHTERCKECKKELYLKNRDVILKRQSEYDKLNKDVINKRVRERRGNDILVRLRHNCSSRLRGSINYDKDNNSIIEILGCSVIDFKKHIESQFKKGMSFDNYGEWELDHILPIGNADSEEEILKRSNYLNIQPLWKNENRIKSNKEEGKL